MIEDLSILICCLVEKKSVTSPLIRNLYRCFVVWRIVSIVREELGFKEKFQVETIPADVLNSLVPKVKRRDSVLFVLF